MSELLFNYNAKWLWYSAETIKEPHQFVFFRKEFEISMEEQKNAEFLISADTDFIAYLNGVEFGRGQFPDYPRDKTYSTFTLPVLNIGRNIITILVYYCGENFQVYAPGQAGLIANIKLDSFDIISDSSWLCCPHFGFKSGIMPKLTSQLGFTTAYDARNDINYFSDIPDMKIWKNAVELASAISGYWHSLKPRSIQPLELELPVSVKIVKQGIFIREKELDTFAETVSKDEVTFTTYEHIFEENPIRYKLNYDSNTGLKLITRKNTVIIFDLGREMVGFITLKLRCKCGTVFDISHGEHLDDGQVRCKIVNRNFTDRYIAKEGLNYYQLPFRRIGGRYIQLNITNIISPVEIMYAGITPWSLPLSGESYFYCQDNQIQQLRHLAIETMKLCMHDHYEDCPWREQALYSYDSRNQIIFGYYIWGNYNFAKTSIDLLGRGIRDDGYLNLCAPTKRLATIPIFSFVWVSEVLEYYLYSGDIELFQRFDQQIEFMINCRLNNFNSANGLYHPGKEEHLWSFYEWVDGLSEMGCASNEYNALYNLYFCEMLKVYQQLLIYNGNNSRAEKYQLLVNNLKTAVIKNFWDENMGCFATKNIDGKLEMYHEHTQFVALTLGLANDEQKLLIANNLYSARLIESSLSTMLYMVKGVLELGERGGNFVQMRQTRAFAPMLAVGATSLWETCLGSQDFSLAGSLCHAWSSLPVYYCHAVVLGINPLEPGFKRFRVSPWRGQLTQASGSVPTPHGLIHICWILNNGQLDLTIFHPPRLTALVEAAPGSPIGKVRIVSREPEKNGKELILAVNDK